MELLISFQVKFYELNLAKTYVLLDSSLMFKDELGTNFII